MSSRYSGLSKNIVLDIIKTPNYKPISLNNWNFKEISYYLFLNWSKIQTFIWKFHFEKGEETFLKIILSSVRFLHE